MKENLHLFLKDFGSKLIFTLVDGTKIDKDSEDNDLLGIFDASSVNPEMGYMVVINSDPQLTCVEADVSNKQIVRGASVSVDGVTYKVVTNTPDGTGFSIIKLSKQ